MALIDQFLRNQAVLASTETTDQNRDIALEKFNERKNLRSVGIGALEALAFKDEASQNLFLDKRIKEIQARDGDAVDTIEARNMPFKQRQDVLKGAVDIAQRAGVLEKSGIASGVSSSKKFLDGTILTVMRDNTRVVTNPAGQVVEGEEAAKVLEKANEFEAKMQGLRSGERTGASELEKRESEIAQEMSRNLNSAPVAIRKLGRVLEVFNAAETGTAEGYKAALGRMFPGATSAELEVALSASGDFVLEGLTRLKGAISEKELAFIQSMSPNVRNSPEGNKLIIQRLLQEERDKLELAEAQRQWKKEGNRLENFDTAGFIARKEAERDEKFNVQDLEGALGLLDTGTNTAGGLSAAEQAELDELERLEAAGQL